MNRKSLHIRTSNELCTRQPSVQCSPFQMPARRGMDAPELCVAVLRIRPGRCTVVLQAAYRPRKP